MSKLDDILEDLMLDVGKDGYFAWSAHRTAKKLIKQEANRKQQIKDLIKSELQRYIREEPYKEEDFDTGWNNAIYAMQDIVEKL